MNVGGMPMFFSPNSIVCFAEVKKCQYGTFQWALLESIFNCLNYSSNMIFAAPSFMKTGLELTEHVGFSNIV